MRREYLIPRKYSTEGPAVAVGDVNSDGLEDIYFGGAKGQAGILFFQEQDGSFTEAKNPFFEQLKMAEDVVAVFEDFNQDGFLDLFVGSGGNEHGPDEFFNFDRIFLNDGKGNLAFSPNSLPPIGQNTSTVAVHDVDGDGFPDLFLGAAVVTGNYGKSPPSHLLINDGHGNFKDHTEQYFGGEFSPGMIQKAVWEDLDGDGKKELLLAGEWTYVQIYKRNDGGIFQSFELETIDDYSGWYFELKVQDLNNDNRMDMVVGNLGLNSKLKSSLEKPVLLYHHDFDQNGQEDPLIFHHMGDRLIPFAGRDDLVKQIPGLKKQHGTYAEYSQIKAPSDVLKNECIQKANIKTATDFRSGIFWHQENGTFKFEPFPIEGQFSPLRDFQVVLSETGQTFVLGLGNFDEFRNDLGKISAMPLVLFEISENEITNIPLKLNASEENGSYRNSALIMIKGEKHILATRNNGEPLFLKIRF